MRESLLPRKDTYLAKVTAQVKGARRASVGELTQLSRSNSHGEGAVVVPFLREQYATQLRHQLGLLNPQLRGFFRGADVTVLKAFPTNAVGFLALSTAKRLLGVDEDEGMK